MGRYVILELLGEGGMGSVYRAYDSELDRKVAIKVLRADRTAHGGDEAQLRLLREAQAMARISHPNVIAVHDVGTVEGSVFLAMDLVEGTTLRRWLRQKPRSWREVLRTFLDAGRGLSAAHAAGLVHRDFKPENVLVSSEGRIFVTDFGLARLSGQAEPMPPEPSGSDESSGPLASELTKTGTVMGTPRYMSPEQHLGKVSDARTDQFSFCAALYEALWNKRPFEPATLAAAALESASKGTRTVTLTATGSGPRSAPAEVIREPPRDPKVPTRIRRAILRGLSLSAEGRFPSLDALLAELSAVPGRARWGWAAAAGIILVTGAVAFAFQRGAHASARARLCTGAPLKLRGVWDGPVRSEVQRAFASSQAPDATARFTETARWLDTYSGSWSHMYHEACAATRIRGEQTVQMLSLRMVCLNRRLDALGALTHLLSTADPSLVGRAAQAAASLPSIRDCADVVALTDREPMPTEPATRRRIGAAQKLLSEATALRLAGRYPPALDRARKAAKMAEPLGYPPLRADALYQEGMVLKSTGKHEEAHQALVSAFAFADEGKADRSRARIATALVAWASPLQRWSDAEQWATLGRAVLTRLGGDPVLEGELLNSIGTVQSDRYEWAKAATTERRALALLQGALAPDSPAIADIESNLAVLDATLARSSEAIPLARKATDLIRRLRGPNHPTLVAPYTALSMAYADQGKSTDALRFGARALEIAQASFGENSRKVSTALDNQATLLQQFGKYPQAIALYRQGLKVKQALWKKGNTNFAYAYGGIGQCLSAEGQAKEAIPWLEKALAFHLPDSGENGNSHFALATALWKLGRKDGARKAARAAGADYHQAKKTKEASAVAAWLKTH